MKAEIISIGTELLLGEIVDTNATYIAQKLREIGIDLYYKTTVGDNEQRIAKVVDLALDRADVVLTTGGLGPTVDDVTREGIASATQRPLEFKQVLLDQIADRFKRFKVTMSDNNRQQAFIPQGALAVENPVGTAPAFILETARGTIITFPGVPREMKYLLEHEIIPWLKANMDTPAVIKSLTLRTAGIGESQIDSKIGDLMTGQNPTVGLAAHTGQTDIRITAKANDEPGADQLIAPLEQEIRARLGAWIYTTGNETIEEVVVKMLDTASRSVVSHEIGTGHILKVRFDKAAKSSSGVVKTHVAQELPEDMPLQQYTEQLAIRLRNDHLTDYSLVVIIQEEIDNGHSGTAIACASQSDVMGRYFEWTTTSRSDVPIWATTHAFAMLRRMLLKEMNL